MEYTDIGFFRLDRILIWGVPPLLGGVIGWFIPAIAKWGTGLTWVPFQGPLELIASFNEPWFVIITAILGLIAGIVLSYISFHESLLVRLSDREITLRINKTEQAFAREDVAVAFLDGKQLVLLGLQGQELSREKSESKSTLVAEACKKHGYSWLDGDPFANEYVRWVADSPELTPSMNALLLVREKALEKGEKKDVADLRRELAKLGITVRNEGKKQYWRMNKDRSTKYNM